VDGGWIELLNAAGHRGVNDGLFLLVQQPDQCLFSPDLTPDLTVGVPHKSDDL
jgi:hypothetical protein